MYLEEELEQAKKDVDILVVQRDYWKDAWDNAVRRENQALDKAHEEKQIKRIWMAGFLAMTIIAISTTVLLVRQSRTTVTNLEVKQKIDVMERWDFCMMNCKPKEQNT